MFIENDLSSLKVTFARWQHELLSSILDTILTRWMVNFEVSRAVPVCYIAILYDITLFTVEHKKIRIRQILLYAKI
jgi:hypothetical protein